jgi:rSAM/selenodomain-associated transferase 2
MAVLTVSILVPTLDEELAVQALLDDLQALAGTWEVIVADGGSRDATVSIAREHPSAPRVLIEAGGRAAQCNAAAALATGDVLVVLHADSRLPPDAYTSLTAAWLDGALGGNFALQFDGGTPFARALTAVYATQRRLGIYYGDSSVWVRRDVWEALGGVRALPIMDDYDFVQRLEALGGTRRLPGPATTSDRRWRRIGIGRTVLSWIAIRWLYLAGVSPHRLARLYRLVR